MNGTGVSESAAIQNENSYSNSVNDAIVARDNALRGLDEQIATVKAGGDETLSELESAYASNLSNLLANQANSQWSIAQQAQANQNNLIDSYVNLLNAQNQQNIANNQWQQQFDYAAAQDELNRQNALAAASAKAYSNGSSNDYTLNEITKVYEAAKANGQPLSDTQVQAYKNWYGFDPVLYDETNVKAGVNQLKKALAQGESVLQSAYEQGLVPSPTWNDATKAAYLKQLQRMNGWNLTDNDLDEILYRVG